MTMTTPTTAALRRVTRPTSPPKTAARGIVRVLSSKEGSLLFEHLLRLDPESRHDRFNGFIDEGFLAKYAAKSISDGTVIVAYLEGGKVRGAAELHQPDLTAGSLPEIAFSVETEWRRSGLGSLLFAKLIEKAREAGYKKLRITTNSQNDPMRKLAHKFGAELKFRQGESTGTIDVSKLPRMPSPNSELVSAMADWGRAWLKAMTIYGPSKPH